VLVPVSRTRAAVMFVDNRARVIFGQRYVDGPGEGEAAAVASDVMAAIRAAYAKEAEAARTQGAAPPPASQTLRRIREAIALKLRPAPAAS
jgi:hypothetical protein